MSDKKLSKEELLCWFDCVGGYHEMARDRFEMMGEQAYSQIKEIIEQHFGGKNEKVE